MSSVSSTISVTVPPVDETLPFCFGASCNGRYFTHHLSIEFANVYGNLASIYADVAKLQSNVLQVL